MRRVATPGVTYWMDNLFTICVGTLGTIAFTMYKAGAQLSQLVILYFAGSW